PPYLRMPPAGLMAADRDRVARSAADDRRLIRGQTEHIGPPPAPADDEERTLGLRESIVVGSSQGSIHSALEVSGLGCMSLGPAVAEKRRPAASAFSPVLPQLPPAPGELLNCAGQSRP